jgi:hypothetical protein
MPKGPKMRLRYQRGKIVHLEIREADWEVIEEYQGKDHTTHFKFRRKE